jgi:hypothetical protein
MMVARERFPLLLAITAAASPVFATKIVNLP